MTHNGTQIIDSDSRLRGDADALLEQMGDAAAELGTGLVPAVAEMLQMGAPLPLLLHRYRETLLEPVELPAILAAWNHAHRGEVRELIQLDARLARDARTRMLGLASAHAGRHQLRRLLPLKDDRTVQRYWTAVEEGQATGWHTVVYGLMLGLYSIPPRDGLLAYSRRTLGALAQRAARGRDASQAELHSAVEAVCDSLRAPINTLLAPQSGGLRIAG